MPSFRREDSRPEAVVQGRLQKLAQESGRNQELAQLSKLADAHSPVKKLAQTKTTRFQQIATDMGDKYGVDTSGLKATHQSTFPATLHAEATIQGNHIHFAPGKDTDENMRHEVAHAIDNTLNGTPKGDRLVNGQKVDTTREQVVNQMAKSTKDSDRVLPIQRQPVPASAPIFQLLALDTQVASNTLNIVGENHPKSNKRRGKEHAYTQDKFNCDNVENCYWQEFQIKSESNNTVVYGDPAHLGAQQLFLRIHENLSRIFRRIDKYENSSSKREAKKNESQAKASLSKNLNGAEFLLGGSIKTDLPRMQDDQVYQKYTEFINQHLITPQNTIRSIMLKKKWFGGVPDKYEVSKVRAFKKVDLSGVKNTIEGMMKAVEDFIVQENPEFQGSNDYERSVSEKRSANMREFAQNNAPQKKGIWKVGDEHINEIKEEEEKQSITARPYKLINMASFNGILEGWEKK